ncbi:glucuronate isomerase [Pleomorphomonas carboxyditropha]|uniref:Uronate isomerase n=1 Tax=Pleomorphomonas carboxyditropha TaxID=2023338 RepID=A0A2G9WZP0_9HYPH|nr:glucuronate isomerase [Pleomorphomonas carboxyditropha]PIP00189.1 glucuronate isomerase [Pleomorphomonas carboxyditropha]
MPSFVTETFLLTTRTAEKLYFDVAADLPIVDYHSHLPPREIAERKRFRNIGELWLAGDHYKWRQMRTAGISEELITGAAADRDKFDAYCRIMPLLAGNPIYHWSHLELKRLFGIDLDINARTAPAIWEAANAALDKLDTWALLEQARVEVACTTDDPADALDLHAVIADSPLTTRVLPAYRPDAAMRINAAAFGDYLGRLAGVSGIAITDFEALVAALRSRVGFFHARGGRVSDHAVDTALPVGPVVAATLQALFAKRLGGASLTPSEEGVYLSGLLERLGGIYAEYGWTMCLHIGAQRNNNSRQMRALGPDTGYDSVSDLSSSAGLASLLDRLDADGRLPKTMLFCLNRGMNEVLSTLIGCFQGGSVPGKLQFGPAWWFNDHLDGNLEQIRTLANHSALGTFVGMVTDSRSFASYPRHDYFRRLLCRQLGEWVEAGEFTSDAEALATIVRGVAYENAKGYFGF